MYSLIIDSINLHVNKLLYYTIYIVRETGSELDSSNIMNKLS